MVSSNPSGKNPRQLFSSTRENAVRGIIDDFFSDDHIIWSDLARLVRDCELAYREYKADGGVAAGPGNTPHLPFFTTVELARSSQRDNFLGNLHALHPVVPPFVGSIPGLIVQFFRYVRERVFLVLGRG
ncbi:hypothetical protein BKA70DRAFT_1235154 [Coprinopsis sp. MPI-PUGE-AT-0042]|nr:hypothetical protein BKA70DRAFT_1235154 [Coprinopsis sp. MPI-PUGE-AT-0042]